MYIYQGSRWSQVLSITPWVTNSAANPPDAGRIAELQTCCVNGVVHTPLFQRFAALYEEVKIDSVHHNITLTSPLSNTQVPSLTFHTAWDRKTSPAEIAYRLNANTPTSAHYPDWASGEIASYSSHSSAIATSNSIPKIVRSLYASDLLEKISYVDSDYLPNDATLFLTDQQANATRLQSYWPNGQVGNANSPYYFSPSFYLQLEAPDINQSNRPIPMMVQTTYVCTFRNPKFGQTGGGSRMMNPGPELRHLPPGDDGADGPGMDENLDGVALQEQQDARLGWVDMNQVARIGEMAGHVADMLDDPLNVENAAAVANDVGGPGAANVVRDVARAGVAAHNVIRAGRAARRRAEQARQRLEAVERRRRDNGLPPVFPTSS